MIRKKNPPTRLQAQRKISGYSQRELAEKVGISVRTLQQYEIRAKDINKAAGMTLLALAKAAVGLVFGSIATVADAVNNLTDAASSVITLVGFRLARKKPDADHPYGHGRAEYISGLVMAFIVLMLGFTLAKDSAVQIFKPKAMEFSYITVAVLALAVIAKLWLSRFFKALQRQTGSATFAAASADSRNDTLSTFAVLVSVLVFKFTSLNIDGITGLAVSVFIEIIESCIINIVSYF
jgi:cation diffusion facilitator family transporter